MKKNHTILVVGAALSALPFFAMAQTAPTVPPRPVQIREEVRDARTQLKQDIQEKREDVKDLREQGKQEIKDLREEGKKEIQEKKNNIRGIELTNRVNNTVRMLTATANRLDAIIVRIESRLAKITAAKGDTTALVAAIATAKTDMASARTHIATIGSIDLSGASTTVKANFEKIKTETKLAKDLYDKVRKDLVRVTNDLRELGKVKKVNDDAPKEIEVEKPVATPTQ